MPRRKYWLYVNCALCKVEMGEFPTTKENDGKIARSICPMCVARKYKGRKFAYLVSIPGGVKQVKPKRKAKRRRKKK